MCCTECLHAFQIPRIVRRVGAPLTSTLDRTEWYVHPNSDSSIAFLHSRTAAIMPRLTNYISQSLAKKPVQHAAVPVESPPAIQDSTPAAMELVTLPAEEEHHPNTAQPTPESSSHVEEEVKRLTALHQRRYEPTISVLLCLCTRYGHTW